MISKGNCSICYEENTCNFTLGCSHSFHRVCLLQWSSAKFTHGEINCPVCRTPLCMELLITNAARVRGYKELNSLGVKGLLQFIKCNKSWFEIEDKYSLEEIEVYAPLIHTYMTDPNKFYLITDVLLRVETQNKRFGVENDISHTRRTRVLPWNIDTSDEVILRNINTSEIREEPLLSREEVDIGDGIQRRLLQRRRINL